MTEPITDDLLDRFAAEIEQSAPEFERRDRPHDQAGWTLAGISRDLLAEVRQTRAKLAAVRNFAEGMRGYCSPHGVSVHYADQLTAVLDAPLAAVLPALPKRDRGATLPVITVACPTCQAQPSVPCANRAAEHSHIKRRLVHSGAVIADPTPTVALTDADMADMGLDPETGLHVRSTPDAAPVVAEEAPADDMVQPFTPESVGVFCDMDDAMWFARCDAEGWESASCITSDEAEQLRLRHIEQHAAPAVGPAATDRQEA